MSEPYRHPMLVKGRQLVDDEDRLRWWDADEILSILRGFWPSSQWTDERCSVWRDVLDGILHRFGHAKLVECIKSIYRESRYCPQPAELSAAMYQRHGERRDAGGGHRADQRGTEYVANAGKHLKAVLAMEMSGASVAKIRQYVESNVSLVTDEQPDRPRLMNRREVDEFMREIERRRRDTGNQRVGNLGGALFDGGGAC